MIDFSSLTNYVADKGLVLSPIFSSATDLQYFKIEDGVFEGQVAVRVYTPGGALGACCTIPDGGEFTEILLPVTCITSAGEWCNEDLAKFIHNAELRIAAGKENAGSVGEVIINAEIGAVAKKIQQLIWNGDTSSSNPDLAFIDGLLKGVTPTATTATNVAGAIVDALGLLPDDAFDQGKILVFVPAKLLAIYNASLAYANLPANTVPGYSDVELIGTSGLTNKIVATPADNILYGTNSDEDKTTVLFDYDNYHQKFYWRLKFLLGVKVIYPDYFKVVDASTVIAAGNTAAGAIPVYNYGN